MFEKQLQDEMKIGNVDIYMNRLLFIRLYRCFKL